MRDVTLVILNSLRIKCHIRRPLIYFMTIFFIKPIQEVPMRVSYRYVGRGGRG